MNSTGALATVRATTSYESGTAVCSAPLTFNAASNTCEGYSCPAGQNFTLSGQSCSRPDCVTPEVRNPDTGICEAPPVVCPTLDAGGSSVYSGYQFVSVPSGVDPNSPMNDICDPNNCAVNINVVTSIFGVALVRKVPAVYACPASPPAPPALPATLTVTFVSAAAPEKTNFDAVVAAPAAVDAAKTAQAQQDAYIAKVVADGIAVKMAADTAALTAAIDAQKLLASEVRRKAGEVVADPSVTNLNNYNNAVSNYNNSTTVVNQSMTQLRNDYAVQVANSNNADASVFDANAVNAQIDALQAAIATSAQAFDAASVNAGIGDNAALVAQLSAASAALAQSQSDLAAASALATQSAVDIAATASSLRDTAAVIESIVSNQGGLPPPVAPTELPPSDGSLTPFCVDNPTASACVVPETIDCTVTPNAPGCQSMSGTPTVGTLAISGVYVAGTLNEGKTFANVFDNFKSRASAAPVIAAATSFFSVTVAGGSCPSWSTEVPMFGTFVFDFYCRPFFQNLLPWMRGVILLIFGVVAFRIAVL